MFKQPGISLVDYLEIFHSNFFFDNLVILYQDILIFRFFFKEILFFNSKFQRQTKVIKKGGKITYFSRTFFFLTKTTDSEQITVPKNKKEKIYIP